MLSDNKKNFKCGIKHNRIIEIVLIIYTITILKIEI